MPPSKFRRDERLNQYSQQRLHVGDLSVAARDERIERDKAHRECLVRNGETFRRRMEIGSCTHDMENGQPIRSFLSHVHNPKSRKDKNAPPAGYSWPRPSAVTATFQPSSQEDDIEGYCPPFVKTAPEPAKYNTDVTKVRDRQNLGWSRGNQRSFTSAGLDGGSSGTWGTSVRTKQEKLEDVTCPTRGWSDRYNCTHGVTDPTLSRSLSASSSVVNATTVSRTWTDTYIQRKAERADRAKLARAVDQLEETRRSNDDALKSEIDEFEVKLAKMSSGMRTTVY